MPHCSSAVPGGPLRILRSAALVGALALVLLPTAAVGRGHASRHLDQVGDVAYFLYDGNHAIPVVDPNRTIGDIRGLHAAHLSTVVHVAMYVRSLPRAGIKNEYEFTFKSPGLENFRNLRIVARPGNWAGYPFLTNYSGKKISCPGLRYLIEYSHKRVVVDVPRSCLGSPEYVRVAAQDLYFVSDRVWVDDAQFPGEGYADVVFGPALHR